jgi:hypothetical protein
MAYFFITDTKTIDNFSLVSGEIGTNVTNWNDLFNYAYVLLNEAQLERLEQSANEYYVMTGIDITQTFEYQQNAKFNELDAYVNGIVTAGYASSEYEVTLACTQADIARFNEDLNGLNNLISLDMQPENVVFLDINSSPIQLSYLAYKTLLANYYVYNRSLVFWSASKKNEIANCETIEQLNNIVFNFN